MKILFITHHNKQDAKLSDYYKYSDYLSDLTLHGLRELEGNEVVDYPGSWHLYEDEIKKRNYETDLLWGKGFTYKNILSNYNAVDRSNIGKKIEQKYFDLIVYGNIRRSNLFIDDVVKYDNKVIFIDGSDDNFIEEKYLKLGIYFKRECSKTTQRIKPINLSVPKSKICKEIDRNPEYLIAPLIPQKNKTYIYKNEQDYYKMYQKSIFGLTFKKVGWDCMRHYEIMMNGCIPFFLNIQNCPKTTMTNFPKQKIYKINKKYEFILNSQNPFKIFIKEHQKKPVILYFLK